mgnify:CR=1 FL=1|jgi:hypothetical protein
MTRTQKKRTQFVETLCKLRKNWTLQDFQDAYSDEWETMPTNLKDCHEKMEEYIYYTYTDELMVDCIASENDRNDKD